MRRTVFSSEHEDFRAMIRAFIESEVTPVYDKWFEEGIAPRDFYYKLGELGIFGIEIPAEYGGAGLDSYKFQAIITEECARAGVSFGGSSVHIGLCLPYLKALATEEQKQRWYPGMLSGETMFAIAMTEPGTGSDLAGMRTTAKPSDDGTHYVLNGSKTFITGGVHADRVIVCARTAPPREDDRRFGITLLVVDTKSAGYQVGRKLDKLGLRVSDTAELNFTDVIVPPAEDVLGEVDMASPTWPEPAARTPRHRRRRLRSGQGRGAVRHPVHQRPHRLRQAGRRVPEHQVRTGGLPGGRRRPRGGGRPGDGAHDLDELTPPADAASAKLFCTDVAARVIDRCLQLHGGYGYINEYPIARLYADNRVSRIYGGTSEVMKMIIAKNMGL